MALYMQANNGSEQAYYEELIEQATNANSELETRIEALETRIEALETSDSEETGNTEEPSNTEEPGNTEEPSNTEEPNSPESDGESNEP